MKKILCTILAFLLSGVMTSCTSDRVTLLDEYEVLEWGVWDCGFLATHMYDEDEIALSRDTDSVAEFKLFRDKAIRINDEEIQGTYTLTYNSYLYRGELEGYRYETPERIVKMGINKNTGRCDSYYSQVKTEKTSSNNEAVTKSREECLVIAREYFNQYVSDPSSYVLSKEKDFWDEYQFYFSRQIDGLLTRDEAIITVDDRTGEVTAHTFTLLEEFKNQERPSDEVLQAVEAAVNERLDVMHTNSKISHSIDEFHVEYEEKEIKLSKMADGRLVLEYFLKLNYTPKNEGLTYSGHDCFSFRIYLE